MRLHLPAAKAILIAAAVVAACGAVAFGATIASRSGSPPPPAQLPSPGEQQRIDDEAQRAATVAEPSRAAELSKDFRIFRRSQVASDTDGAPAGLAGDITRRVTTDDGSDVYVIGRGDQICLAIRGGSACGPLSAATTKPLTAGFKRVDGTETVVYGAAADAVTEVRVTMVSGATYTTRPNDNVYKLIVPGQIQTIALVSASGATTTIAGPR